MGLSIKLLLRMPMFHVRMPRVESQPCSQLQLPASAHSEKQKGRLRESGSEHPQERAYRVPSSRLPSDTALTDGSTHSRSLSSLSLLQINLVNEYVKITERQSLTNSQAMAECHIPLSLCVCLFKYVIHEHEYILGCVYMYVCML